MFENIYNIAVIWKRGLSDIQSLKIFRLQIQNGILTLLMNKSSRPPQEIVSI